MLCLVLQAAHSDKNQTLPSRLHLAGRCTAAAAARLHRCRSRRRGTCCIDRADPIGGLIRQAASRRRGLSRNKRLASSAAARTNSVILRTLGAWGCSTKPFLCQTRSPIRDLRRPMIEALLSKLEQRLGGRLYAKQRLGIETDHEAQIFGQGLTFFHIENWYSIHSVMRTLFKLTGLYWRGQANAARVQVRHNNICFRKLPPAFDDFTLLHMSDFHADMNHGAMRQLEEMLVGLKYDLCV